MPSYNYKCKQCNECFIVFRKISQKTLTFCSDIPKNNCKENGRLIRIITGGSGISFKGTGFYLTDYSKKK